LRGRCYRGGYRIPTGVILLVANHPIAVTFLLNRPPLMYGSNQHFARLSDLSNITMISAVPADIDQHQFFTKMLRFLKLREIALCL
jgi:hypothetical protein